MYQHILLATDGSKRSDRAARHAIELAKRLGASITAMHVVPTEQMFLDQSFVTPVTISQSLKNQFKKQVALASQEILDKVRAQAATAGVQCEALSDAGALLTGRSSSRRSA